MNIGVKFMDKDNIKIRLLRADEIEIRAASISEKGVSLLLYKDARVDMSILDEIFGVYGWQRTHQIIDGKCFCSVAVKHGDSWIVKQDVGQETYADPVKGAASDSFKRACTNIGIGRELYTAPFIWIPVGQVNIENRGGKRVLKDKFKVRSIEYDDKKRCITGLEIENQLGTVVYRYSDGKTKSSTERKAKTQANSKKKRLTVKQTDLLMQRLRKNGISLEAVLNKHNLSSLEEMDIELYNRAMLAMADPDDIAV